MTNAAIDNKGERGSLPAIADNSRRDYWQDPMFSPRLLAKTYTQTLPACGSLPSLAGEFMGKR
jgi:hypothetical protein